MARKLAIGRFVMFWQFSICYTEFSICYTDCRFTSDVESIVVLRVMLNRQIS